MSVSKKYAMSRVNTCVIFLEHVVNSQGTDPQLKCEMRKVKDDLKDLEKFLQDSEKQRVRLQEEIDNYSQEQKSLQISEGI